MIPSAAKNNKWVSVVVDPKDYKNIQKSISGGGISEKNRLKLAGKAFDHCASYDRTISTELEEAALHLRYGENPHQKAFVLKEKHKSFGLPQAKQIQGKEMSYNNFLDGEAALLCLYEFKEPSCVIIKHGSPCGVGSGKTPKAAFLNALKVDPLSAFGGVIAMNKRCGLLTAKELNKIFFEIIIAPSFDNGALSLFSKKKNLRVLSLGKYKPKKSFGKEIAGGFSLSIGNPHVIFFVHDFSQFDLKKIGPTIENHDYLPTLYPRLRPCSHFREQNHPPEQNWVQRPLAAVVLPRATRYISVIRYWFPDKK
jgi:phosphoribosylaminoimidazolecarboxamide formyltransferase/IMP cyclohydrolase